MRISAWLFSASLLAACSATPQRQPASPPRAELAPPEVDSVLLQPVPADEDAPETTAPAAPASHCPGECEALAKSARAELVRIAASPERQVVEATHAAEALESAWGTCASYEHAKEQCDLPGLVRDMAEANRIAGRTFDQGAALLVMSDPRYGLHASPEAQEAQRSLRAMAAKAEQDAASGTLDPPSMALAALVELAFQEPPKARAIALELRQSAPRSEHTAPLMLAVARDEARRGQWSTVSTLLGNLQLGPDRPELFLEREALLGEAIARRGQGAAAQAYFRRVVAAWEAEPEDSRQDLLAQVRPHPLLDRDDLSDALGAAYFHRAEEKRRALEQDKRPRLRGKATSAAVAAYARDVFAPWMRRQQEGMQEANAAYLRVIEIKPPPYRWVVASGERVGHMTYAFVEEMRAIPAPEEIKKDPRLLASYENALQGASEPMVERAKAAYRTCAGTAELHGDPDGVGAKCRQWLSAHP